MRTRAVRLPSARRCGVCVWGLGRTTVAASYHTDHRLVTARRPTFCPIPVLVLRAVLVTFTIVRRTSEHRAILGPRVRATGPDGCAASLFAQRPPWHCVSISHFYRRKTPWVKHLDLRLRYRRASSLDALLKRSSRAATHTPPSYRSGPEACKGGAAPFGNPRQGAGPRPPPPGHPGQSHFSAQRAHRSR